MLIFVVLFQALKPEDVASTVLHVLSTPSRVEVHVGDLCHACIANYVTGFAKTDKFSIFKLRS